MWWRTNASYVRRKNISSNFNLTEKWKLHLENLGVTVKGHIFFIVRNCSFFMGIIFCSNTALVWAFNTRGVYNFITKEANIPVNLVPFFNDISFLFCRLLKSGVTNELKSLFLWKSKKNESCLFQTGQNFAAHKTLVWSTYVWRIAIGTEN